MHIPFVGGNQNEQVNEAENTRERRTYAGGAVLRILGMKLVSPQIASTVAANARWYSRPSAFKSLERKGSSARNMA